MMVGMPDYGTYVAHMQKNHPGQPFMDYETFCKERINARYGDGGKNGPMRCC
ncbi:MAG: YbdD/YjiX family protein, partial [Burkholderiaceae bacterium]|jgi:uncharacterized short protein YbdD (DUF466 family)|nr:YbdD/YjiX family protein [Burkholderiaceae bacterium]